jgi:hypothetical protein
MSLANLFRKTEMKKEETKQVYLWKSMKEGVKSAHGEIKWKIGKWHKEDKAIACQKGFHASVRAIDAFQYVNCEVLCKVEVRGTSDIESDKQCWSEMRIVEAYVWEKKDSVALAIFAAEKVIGLYKSKYPKDLRPREAIEAAKKWLRNPTEKNREVSASASYAAYASASSASYAASASASYASHASHASASYAAYAASASASYAAYASASASYASSAYASAAYASYAYAYAAYAKQQIIDECDEWIMKRVKKLKSYDK